LAAARLEAALAEAKLEGHCKDCTYYAEHWQGCGHESMDDGVWNPKSDGVAACGEQQEASLKMGPGFGCIHWEAKE
jgi:hypothetical protein